MDPLAGGRGRGIVGAVTPVSLSLGDQTLDLLPERAAFWREEGALVVADCHFGKAAAFRSHGLAVPEGGTADDLGRLEKLVAVTGARQLMVAGDFFHAPSGYRAAVMEALVEWRGRHPGLRITLVPGNHDRGLERVPAALGLEVVGDPHAVGPFRFGHDPAGVLVHDSGGGGGTSAPVVTLCGHLHPAVRLGGRRERGLCAPCFWLRRDAVLVLPSFGSFTGSAVIGPGPGDRVFAVASGRVLEVPGEVLGKG